MQATMREETQQSLGSSDEGKKLRLPCLKDWLNSGGIRYTQVAIERVFPMGL